MITVRTTKTAKESLNVTLQSSDASLLNKFVNEYTDYSIEPLKAGTYNAIFSTETFDDGVPIFKVFDRYERDGHYAGHNVHYINLTIPDDTPVAKGKNNLGLEECWIPFDGGWAWIDFMPSKNEVHKLSEEGQEEVAYNGPWDFSTKYGHYAEKVIRKTLLDFEKTITNGKYFNGKSILSDKAFIKNAFNGIVSDSAWEYPNLTMTMTGADVKYQLLDLYEQGASNFLQFTFNVDCTDSNGDSFKAELVGRMSVKFPGDGFEYDYLKRL